MNPYTYDYNQIDGFGEHDFAGFYEAMVDLAPRGAVIVETGCFHGRSLVQLGLYAQAKAKGIQVIGIDHCIDQSAGCEDHLLGHLDKSGLSYDALDSIPAVRFIKEDCVKAAQLFNDNSVWMVFLDDDHSHEAVAAEIDAWMPKIDKHGYLCGHDCRWHSVWEPVYAKLKDVIHDPKWDNVWYTRKQIPLQNDLVDIRKSVRIEGEFGPFGYGYGDKRNDGGPSGVIKSWAS